MNHFHPAIKTWFDAQFDQPTPTQLAAWEAISEDHHALIAAPTGSGKTLAAFLTAIDGLVKQAEAGQLENQVSVVYVSPLKALSNDINRNLQHPLSGVHQYFENLIQNDGLEDHPDNQASLLEHQEPTKRPVSAAKSALAPELFAIRAAVRTGDTSQSERAKMIKTPPHILVTTPESLYILLTSESGRKMLSTAKTVIVDEIHALITSKRGAHLALSLERLQGLCANPLTRIGLSATQEPVETVSEFLTGTASSKACRIINSGHHRQRDIQVSLPRSPLSAVMSADEWGEVYDNLESLIEAHTTTLIFVNTRRLAERLAKALGERIGDEYVTSHHGSLAKEHRFSAEQRLKSGTLKALVATASLELGIDIGNVDLVCQIGSPRAVSVFLQRVGRSGHGIGQTPKGRLFPLSRDDLTECVALIHAINEGELDQLTMYPQPLDVLAQQIVAEVAGGERTLDELFIQVTAAAPYRGLTRSKFDEVIHMLADGFSTRRGRRSAYLHLDAVNGKVAPRKGARLTALTNGGTIPDQFDYDVILQPDGLKIGTLNEDFSFESLAGDIFQLGNISYQILRVELGKVFVCDAKGKPPSIPFWFGEAPGRTDAMSIAVSRLRENFNNWLKIGRDHGATQLEKVYGVVPSAAKQLADYFSAAHSALGTLPTFDTVIFERFFDQAGDQHLVVHSPFGSRVNRAWGLALRKRFCRKFNFELQAAALEDTIVLSLGSTHSFPLEEVIHYLKSTTVEDVLTQALLDSPMFPTHWRWNASIALAVRRFSGGKKSPPQFQRSDAEDLIAVVFPDQIACAENIAGKREIPEHPLIDQTIYDCLNDLMDIRHFESVLRKIENKHITIVCKDLIGPSPLAEEVLTAKPYAFLDDAPAEERRTSLVRTRQFLHPEDAAQLSELDAEVIREVQEEAWPSANTLDECHDALMILGVITEEEGDEHQWLSWLSELSQAQRACQIELGGRRYWVCAERLAYWLSMHPVSTLQPSISPVLIVEVESPEEALVEVVRMRLQGMGPVSENTLAQLLQLPASSIAVALLSLEQEGYGMQGSFLPDDGSGQWCERGLLARIHRRTIKHLRKQINPVSINSFMTFLFHWQGLDDDAMSSENDPEALAVVLEQLEGIEVSAGAWESSVLPSRLNGYMNYWLDILCSSGRVSWARLTKPAVASGGSSAQVKKIIQQSPIALSSRHGLAHWLAFSGNVADTEHFSAHARRLYGLLEQSGAQFFDDIVAQGGWLKVEVEQALSELIANGVVTSDNYAGLRELIQPAAEKRGFRGRRRMGASPMSNSGRWSIVKNGEEKQDEWKSVEYIVGVLLKRYGVLFRRLIEVENSLPPWRDLHYVLRRMEARGEVRGGRFVHGFAGEQFALPEAVGQLRKLDKEENDRLVSISAADPLNLTGFVLPISRVPGIIGNRILFRGGKVIATFVGGEVKWITPVDEADQWRIEQKLISIPKAKLGRYQHIPYSVVH